jgi:hypothetical protein
MTTPDEEPFSELVDPDIHRMDQVDKAANGTPWLIAKSAAPEGGPALFDPQFVREQVEKAEAQAAPERETVTMTGSPSAIAKLMKEAADRRAVEVVAKADLSTADVNDLPDSAFAYIEPGGTKDEQGKTTPRSKRHFPVHDAAHVRNALSRAPQSPFGEKAMPKIRAAANHFGVEVAKADGAAEPGSPAWEGQDAATADGIVQAILALCPRLEAFAAREGAEVGAGDMGDLGDVFDLQAARDCLMQAAKLVGGVAVAEHAESGAVAKAATTTPAAHAAPQPQESTVTNTDTTGVREGEQAATTTGTETAAATEVAKGAFGLTEAELAEIGRRALLKKAAKAAAAKASGAAAPDDARVIPGTETVQAPAAASDDVAKAVAAQLAPFGEAMASVVKQLGELTTQMGSQTGRVEKALAQPDDRRSPLLNGATGEAGLAPSHRGDGFERSPEFDPIRKALAALPDGPAKEQAQREVAIAAIKGRFGNA